MLKNKISIILFFLLLLFSCTKNRFEKRLEDHEIPISFGGEYNTFYESLEPNIVIAKNKSGNSIKIQMITVKNQEQATEMLNQSLKTRFSQFHFTSLAFNGKAEMAEACRQEYMPKIYNLAKSSFVTAYVDERFALCICQKNKPIFKRATAFYRDKNKRYLLIVDYFSPTETSLEKIQLFFENNFVSLNLLTIPRLIF